jgi:hypothetical protein
LLARAIIDFPDPVDQDQKPPEKRGNLTPAQVRCQAAGALMWMPSRLRMMLRIKAVCLVCLQKRQCVLIKRDPHRLRGLTAPPNIAMYVSW